MQVLLIATLAFAAVWFVALRPKTDPGGAPATPAAAKAAPPAKSAVPGAPGDALDKARATSAQADAAVPSSGPQTAPVAATPRPQPRAAQPPAAPRAGKRKARRAEPAGASPHKVRQALLRRHAVVLLFYSDAGADDRAVHSEVAGVARRGGRVNVWSVPVSGLSRFKNVLAGAQVLQTPAVLILSPRGRPPVLLNGYTDVAEIDQITAAALRKPR